MTNACKRLRGSLHARISSPSDWFGEKLCDPRRSDKCSVNSKMQIDVKKLAREREPARQRRHWVRRYLWFGRWFFIIYVPITSCEPYFPMTERVNKLLESLLMGVMLAHDFVWNQKIFNLFSKMTFVVKKTHFWWPSLGCTKWVPTKQWEQDLSQWLRN